jgi:single-stranded DNA-specific DHH superfamily exonuclease
MGDSGTALELCLESGKAKKKAEAIHTKYRQVIISGLKSAAESEKIEGNGFVIINARQKIKDTVIGTIASILSNSSVYEEGTMITTMAYYDDKIKVSARSVGNKGRNLRKILAQVVDQTGGEVGGHEFAAGCMIKQEKEMEFLTLLKKTFEIELVKI